MNLDIWTLDLTIRYLERVNPRGQEDADSLDMLVARLKVLLSIMRGKAA